MTLIKRTRRSLVDVTTIWNYIAERNFPAADAWVESLDEKLRLLAANSSVGERVDHLRPGVRRFTIRKYVIYFEPIDGGVRLLRVVHSARQADDLFESLD